MVHRASGMLVGSCEPRSPFAVYREMLKFLTILEVFGHGVSSPGPLRPVHAPTAGSQRESLRKSMLFCSVLLRDLPDPAGCHGLSSACPPAVPFAV